MTRLVLVSRAHGPVPLVCMIWWSSSRSPSTVAGCLPLPLTRALLNAQFSARGLVRVSLPLCEWWATNIQKEHILKQEEKVMQLMQEER